MIRLAKVTLFRIVFSSQQWLDAGRVVGKHVPFVYMQVSEVGACLSDVWTKRGTRAHGFPRKSQSEILSSWFPLFIRCRALVTLTAWPFALDPSSCRAAG